MSKETVQFKTEVKELLDLVIHSLYSNREIFLRELISNAADAVDRARFEGLTKPEVLEGDSDWKIKLIPDEKAGTLTIRDNGVGMDKDTVVRNIGTIARSGTRAFLHELKEKNIQGSPELIGQFGVGFYSSFMVADRVTILSRMAGDPKKGVKWESAGDGAFTVEEAEKEKRGTDVILHLKEEAKDFLTEWTLRSLVKKFSDYIEHPVVMDVEKDKKKEEETLNARKAVWLKNKNEITPEEYNEFYKHVARDFTDPLKIIHFSAEGASEYKALLYLPSKAPFNLFESDAKVGLHLYVKRVFIMDDCKKLFPEYLRFVKGVVDSSDLPLNVSREILQENKEMERIRKGLVNKVLLTLAEMKEKEFARYKTFYSEFGRVLKEGIHFDFENREKIQDLLLFHSTNTDPDLPVSLDHYVTTMRDGQKEIYYAVGESLDELKRSPWLEKFRAKGYEVLFMADPVDEWIMQDMHEYKGKRFKAVNKGEADIEESEEKKAREESEKEFKDLLEYLKTAIPEVKEARISTRLTESACCLVADEHAPGAHMEKLFKAMGNDMPANKPVLEVNASHPLLKNMHALFGRDKESPKLKEYAALLYDQALLMEGQKLKDPSGFVRRLNDFLVEESGK